MSQRRARLVFHAEANPFGAAAPHEAGARALFKAAAPGEEGRFGQFVGFLCDARHTYICLPKVFRALLGRDDVGRLLAPLPYLLRRCLARYTHDNKGKRAVRLYEAYVPDRARAQARPASHLALAHRVLDDYLRHGVWVELTRGHERGGRGRVDWGRTVAAGGELLTRRAAGGLAPVYLTPVTRAALRREDHPLALAQLAVLHDLRALYGAVLAPGAIDLPPLPPHLAHPRALSALGAALRAARPTLFGDRALLLADLLLRYIDLDDRGRRDQVDVYGTTSFEVLFEHMCASVLGAPPLGERDAGQVEWEFNSALSARIGPTTRSGATQRPDLVLTAREEEPEDAGAGYLLYRLCPPGGGDVTWVLDAKYYDLIGALESSRTDNERAAATHLPGLGDIRKQHAYARALARSLSEGARVLNGLLFPTVALPAAQEGGASDEERALLGGAPFQLLGGVRVGTEERIEVLGVSLEGLMGAYARRERWGAVRGPRER